MTEQTHPVVFHFNFNLDPDFHDEAPEADPPHELDDEHNVTYAFAGTIKRDDIADIQTAIDEHADWYEKLFFEQEGEFGVHDWGNDPDDRVLCLGGYSSYEVEPARVRELMNAWRSALLSSPQIDCSLGQVTKVPSDQLENDWDIYQAINAN